MRAMGQQLSLPVSVFPLPLSKASCQATTSTTIITMPPKSRRDHDHRPLPSSKRLKAAALTIGDLRKWSNSLEGTSIIEELPDDEFLRSMYHSLRRKYRPATTRSKLASDTTENCHDGRLGIPASVSRDLPRWLNDPWIFWQSSGFQREAFDANSDPSVNIGTFVQTSWDLIDKLTSFKVLWRFNSVALCLKFMQWKPEWRITARIRTAWFKDFLSDFGCPTTSKDIHKTMSIIRSGQRRLSFCLVLAQQGNHHGRPGDMASLESLDNVQALAQLDTLGLLFLDSVPDPRYVIYRR